MKSAKLLLLAYRSYKKEGLRDVAASLFMEAMADKTAPHLMEKLHKLAAVSKTTTLKKKEDKKPIKKNKKVATTKKKIKTADIEELNEESSSKLGWDESTESWQESAPEYGGDLEDQSEALEQKAIELLKRAQELEKQDESEESESEEMEEESNEEMGETPTARVQISKIQYAQLKAIANKLACKSEKGAKLAHKLLASLKVKKNRK